MESNYTNDINNFHTSESQNHDIKYFEQPQTILQHFYKLLMWQILISSNMSPLLTSHLCFTLQ